MNVLGIDPANRTGFSHTDGYRGVIDISLSVDKQNGQRLLRFANWLRHTLQEHKTDVIAAEDASFGSNNDNTAAMHNELRGVIKMVAAERGIDVRLFAPSTIKKFATGSGRADKPQMVKAAKSFYGLDVPHDVADAIFIMELAKRPDCWATPSNKKAARSRRVRKPTQPKLFR